MQGIFNNFQSFQVLKKEFPKGVDIIYESVGGDMFNLCLNALAVYGRLIVIGMISQVLSSFLFYVFPFLSFF
jgi:NADPH-dependent curcumin reductase CurA